MLSYIDCLLFVPVCVCKVNTIFKNRKLIGNPIWIWISKMKATTYAA
jgi:hypothetical protein